MPLTQLSRLYLVLFPLVYQDWNKDTTHNISRWMPPIIRLTYPHVQGSAACPPHSFCRFVGGRFLVVSGHRVIDDIAVVSTGTCNWLWLCWTAKWFKARMQCVTFSHLIYQHTTRSSAFIWQTFGGFNFMKLTYPTFCSGLDFLNCLYVACF